MLALNESSLMLFYILLIYVGIITMVIVFMYYREIFFKKRCNKYRTWRVHEKCLEEGYESDPPEFPKPKISKRIRKILNQQVDYCWVTTKIEQHFGMRK